MKRLWLWLLCFALFSATSVPRPRVFRSTGASRIERIQAAATPAGPTCLTCSANIIAFWPLTTDSTDSTGNGHNGTDTSVTYSGGAAVFGSGSYVAFTPINLQASGTAYTISFMYKDSGAGAASNEAILASSAGTGNAGVFLTPAGGSTRGMLYNRDGWGPAVNTNAFATTTDNTWHLGIWTYTSGSTYTWYLDGTLIVTGGATGLLADSVDRIGLVLSRQRIGPIKNVGAWGRALTQAEVTSIYNSGSPLAYPF